MSVISSTQNKIDDVDVDADVIENKNEHNMYNYYFYGPHKSGKRTTVNKLLSQLYDTDKLIYHNIFQIDACQLMHPVQTIELQLINFLSKTINSSSLCKLVIVLNATLLPVKLQAIFRKYIEIASECKKTRFIFVGLHKTIMLPLQSRLYCKYIPQITEKQHELYNKKYISLTKLINNKVVPYIISLKNQSIIYYDDIYLFMWDLSELFTYTHGYTAIQTQFIINKKIENPDIKTNLNIAFTSSIEFYSVFQLLWTFCLKNINNN